MPTVHSVCIVLRVASQYHQKLRPYSVTTELQHSNWTRTPLPTGQHQLHLAHRTHPTFAFQERTAQTKKKQDAVAKKGQKAAEKKADKAKRVADGEASSGSAAELLKRLPENREWARKSVARWHLSGTDCQGTEQEWQDWCGLRRGLCCGGCCDGT